MSPGQSKKKVTSIHCKHNRSGTPKIFAPILFSIYTSNPLNIRFVPKKKTKWNSYTSQYLTCSITKTQVPTLNLPCICWKCISACPLIFFQNLNFCRSFNLLFQRFSVCHFCRAHMMVTVPSLPRKLSCVMLLTCIDSKCTCIKT